MLKCISGISKTHQSFKSAPPPLLPPPPSPPPPSPPSSFSPLPTVYIVSGNILVTAEIILAIGETGVGSGLDIMRPKT